MRKYYPEETKNLDLNERHTYINAADDGNNTDCEYVNAGGNDTEV